MYKMATPMKKFVRPAEETTQDDASELESDLSDTSSDNPEQSAPGDPNAAHETDRKPSVASLHLSGCPQITDTTLLHLSANNGDLEELDISDCKHVGDDGIGHLSNMTNLRVLKLAGCDGLTDCGLRHLARRCKKLQMLDLSRCRNISQAGLLTLAMGWPKLTRLDITDCSGVGSKGLHHVANGMFELRCLKLDKRHVSSDGITIASKTLKHLKDIQVSCQDLTSWTRSVVCLRPESTSSSD